MKKKTNSCRKIKRNHLNLELLPWNPVADLVGDWDYCPFSNFYENCKNSRLYLPWLTILNLALYILSSFFLRWSSALLSLVLSRAMFSYWSVTLYMKSSLGLYWSSWARFMVFLLLPVLSALALSTFMWSTELKTFWSPIVVLAAFLSKSIDPLFNWPSKLSFYTTCLS